VLNWFSKGQLYLYQIELHHFSENCSPCFALGVRCRSY
jgi:hypothetical protein